MIQNIQPSTNWRFLIWLFLAITVISIGVFAMTKTMYALNETSEVFPQNTDIVVVSGSSLTEISKSLKKKNIIRSAHYFQFVAKKEFEGKFIQAGTYNFSSPKTTYEVVEALMQGTNLSPLIKVTFPEGFRTDDIYTYLPEQFLSENVKDIKEYEGYLFPDTYFIREDTDMNALTALMQKTFTEKLAPLKERIDASTYTLKDIVILASILEREAKDVESKRIVSGILQNRLSINMPLQVDASFSYLFDKSSDQITQDDLEHDSPFNSYLYTGLPPAPISNPGLESIEAILLPTKTEYLYYLTDGDGVFHYAETFEQHKVNKEQWLR